MTMHESFAKNEAGRDLIVGDIHGCFSKLQAALDAVGFNPDAGDRLFSAGDLVDRGPESARALEWLGKPWFHPVSGNHEQLLRDYHLGLVPAGYYAANGGGWAIGLTPQERQPLIDAIRALPVAITLETDGGPVGIVHANCPTQSWGEMCRRLEEEGPLPEDRAGQMFVANLANACVWDRSRIAAEQDSPPVEGVRAVVVGHTPLKEPAFVANVLHIDTGAVFGWGFTIIDAATLQPAREGVVA